MRKGFTLVELIAVILILAVIVSISVPKLIETYELSKQKAHDTTVKEIIDASKFYLTEYRSNYKNQDTFELSLSLLCTEKYLDCPIYDPITEDEMVGVVSVTRVDGIFEYEYNELSFNRPELAVGMIPVYYDDANYVWKKADYTNTSNSWYNYDNFMWPNAVTVTAATRTSYQNAAVGTTILMTDINTMFVYVPRYKYRIPAGTGARLIDVVLETKFTPKSTGDAISTYYTHPAFTFGTEELDGIWVGKFEMTGTIAAPTIKPDLSSIRTQSIKALYDSIKTIQNNTVYGLNNTSDAHLIKSTEWGAVAYLSNSKYGKYGNSAYTALDKEVYLNNSNSYYTGRSMGTYGGHGVLTPTYEYITAGYYTYDGKCAAIYTGITECETGSVGQLITNKNLSYGATTTGTIYGIYDMVGGAADFAMGMYMPNPMLATGIADESGYSTLMIDSQYDLLTIDSKYYNRYLTTVYTTGAILGDATKEVRSWYGDYATFVSTTYPWFKYGGYRAAGASAGIFSYYYATGIASSSISTRAVIAP